jgi:hypothetical protein
MFWVIERIAAFARPVSGSGVGFETKITLRFKLLTKGQKCLAGRQGFELLVNDFSKLVTAGDFWC